MPYYVNYGIRIRGKKEVCDSIYNSIDNIEGEYENIYYDNCLTAYGTTRGEIDRTLLKEKTGLLKTKLEYFEHGEDYGDMVEYYAIDNGEITTHYSIELNNDCDISYELDNNSFCNLRFKGDSVVNNKTEHNSSKYDEYDSDNKNYITREVKFADGACGQELIKYKGTSDSIIIPEGIFCITNYLANCGKLKRIIMPNSLRGLPIDFFNNYKNLEYLKLNDPYIEYMSDCETYPRVKSNSKLVKDDFVIVDQALFFYIGNKKEVIIPEGVVAIHPYAFARNEIVQTVVMPNSVTRIMEGAFESCSNLENVVFSSNIKKIDYQAFACCGKLKQVNIPKDAELYSLSFEGCLSLVNNDFIIINEYLIQYLGHDQTIKIPDGVRVVCGRSFEYNNDITKVIMPDSVEIIGYDAFESCHNLKEVVASKNIKKIEYGAFSRCKNLEIMDLNNFDDIVISGSDFFMPFKDTKLVKYIERMKERNDE